MHAKSEKYEFCSFLVFEKLRSTVKFGVSTALKNDKDKDKYKDKNRASNTQRMQGFKDIKYDVPTKKFHTTFLT